MIQLTLASAGIEATAGASIRVNPLHIHGIEPRAQGFDGSIVLFGRYTRNVAESPDEVQDLIDVDRDRWV